MINVICKQLCLQITEAEFNGPLPESFTVNTFYLQLYLKTGILYLMRPEIFCALHIPLGKMDGTRNGELNFPSESKQYTPTPLEK